MIRIGKPKIFSEKITLVEDDHIQILVSRLQIMAASFKNKSMEHLAPGNKDDQNSTQIKINKKMMHQTSPPEDEHLPTKIT